MEDVVKTVAGRIRGFRTARGLSVVDLAQRSGISRATLSQLENGRGNPTVETLIAVARELGVPLSDLIDGGSSEQVQFRPATEGAEVSGAALTAHLVDQIHIQGALIEMYDVTLRPGSRQEPPPHAAGVHERVLVSRGRILAGPSDEPREVGPGDYLAFPADQPHVYEALEAARATVLLAYPPPDPSRRGRGL